MLSGEIYRLSVNGKHETVATLRSMISDLLNSNEEPSKLELYKSDIKLTKYMNTTRIGLLANEQRIISIQAIKMSRLGIVYEDCRRICKHIIYTLNHEDPEYSLQPNTPEAKLGLYKAIEKMLAIDIVPTCRTSEFLVGNPSQLKTQVGEYAFEISMTGDQGDRPGIIEGLRWQDKEGNLLTVTHSHTTKDVTFQDTRGSIMFRKVLPYTAGLRIAEDLEWIYKLKQPSAIFQKYTPSR
jgi:hypothetical protein